MHYRYPQQPPYIIENRSARVFLNRTGKLEIPPALPWDRAWKMTEPSGLISEENKMSEHEYDAGVIAVLLKRLNDETLPQTLAMKTRVDRGECLTAHDLDFIEERQKTVKQIGQYIMRHPEYTDLLKKVTALLVDITQTALANEQKK